MTRSTATRDAVRRLRSDGWSLREIASHLGVSLGRTSEWVRDITLEARRSAPDDAKPASALVVWRSGELQACPRCALLLPIELFGRLGDGRQGWCKPCFRGYRGVNRQRARALAVGRIEMARAYVLDLLAARPCTDCGQSDPVVLEFDHVETKRDNISSLVCHGASLARLSEEIDRCEVVCVNCHRMRSARRQGSRRLGGGFVPSTSRPLRDRNLRFLFDRLQASGCVDCGVRELVTLDFDHLHGKTASVSALARKECSIARLEEEIAKCEVRCANCHRRKTAAAFGYYRHRAAEAA